MGLTVSAVTLNSADPASTARFWAQALEVCATDGGNGYVHVRSAGALLIVQPDAQRSSQVAGDVHLDLSAADVRLEVGRLCELGAQVVARRSDSHGSWVVLRDPDGRLFCVSGGGGN